jgi:putative heme-binding domain-containing protein
MGPTQIRAMQALVKAGTPEAMRVVLAVLPKLRNSGRLGDGVRDKSANALFQSPALEAHFRLFGEEATQPGESAIWADAALLHLAARKFGATEARRYAAAQLDAGWKDPARRVQIIHAAAVGREASRGGAIVQALDDPDPNVAAAAKSAVATLKLDVDAIRGDAGQAMPLIATLKPDEVVAQVTALHGTTARGEQLFNQAGCVACHTVSASEPLKGPFLGQVAKMFGRRELAEAILDPNKSIAQGFVTNQFTLKDGAMATGFVTREGADVVVIRDLTGHEQQIHVTDVTKREHLPVSLMPPGLMSGYSVRDFASLLDYLQSLADGGK